MPASKKGENCHANMKRQLKVSLTLLAELPHHTNKDRIVIILLIERLGLWISHSCIYSSEVTVKKFKNPFRRDDRGNIAVMSALTMPLLVGSIGFGVEVTTWYHNDLVLQQTADKAVYAAAIELRAGSSYEKMKNAASAVAIKNGFTAVSFNVFSDAASLDSATYTGSGFSATAGGGNTLDVKNPPISGAYINNKNAIQVIVQKTLPLSFSSFFMSSAVLEKSSSVALMQAAGSSCVLALDTSAAGAITVWGSASLNLTGCNVNSNSTSTTSVQVGGSAHLTTSCVVTVGGVSLAGSQTTQTCASAVTNASAVGDPYASLAVPAAGTIRPNTNGSTLQPGSYAGMNLSGTKTLNPGVYYVSSGSLSFNPNSLITGTGVTFYLAPGVTLNMNNNATVKLAAPTSGTYSGVLMYSDKSNTSDVTFNGTANSLLTGVLYFPSQKLTYNGNFSGTGGCTRVIAKTVDWSGNANIAQDCSALGMANIPSSLTVKLVE